MALFPPTLCFTHTFSECVENPPGMETIGARRAVGLSMEALARAAEQWPAVELTELSYSGERASVLVFPGGVDRLLGEGAADALLRESAAQPFDVQYYDRKRGEVRNKLGRHNNCYADRAQAPCLDRGRGTVISFGDAPRLAELRAALPRLLGEECEGLYAETNRYYDVSLPAVGIGKHGDTERSVVVGVRLGQGSAAMPLRLQWYLLGRPATEETPFVLRHGDIYALSHKAVGADWRRRSIPTLRHCAGLKAPPSRPAAVPAAPPAVVLFYGHGPAQPYREFSNFYAHASAYRATLPLCCEAGPKGFPAAFDAKFSEQAIMAAKAALFGDHRAFARIVAAGTPQTAKKWGRRVEGFDEGLWRQRVEEVANHAVAEKFASDPALAEVLRSTGRAIIAEAAPTDVLWGIGLGRSSRAARDPSQWRGENLLGRALMAARERLAPPGDPGAPAEE
jgi:ribA/ribD-fused uncharacterized protein